MSSGPGTPGMSLGHGGSAGQSPMGSSQQSGVPFRPLNVKDALSYLDRVKVTFSDQPEVYDRFLTIMKDFKSQGIDTPGVIERVSTLFRGHPALIQGFNTFLPPGYRIECTVSTPADEGAVTTITVTTPMGMTTRTQVAGPTAAGQTSQSTSGSQSQQRKKSSKDADRDKQRLPNLPIPPVPSVQSMAASSASGIATPGAVSLLSNHMAPPSQQMTGQAMSSQGGANDPNRPPMEFNHAINYVNKIKNRFVREPETYKAFLEILQTYQKEGRAIQDVYAQVTTLFHGAPDLLDEFKQFLPDTSQEQQQASMSAALGGSAPQTSKRSADKAPSGQSQKKKSRSKPAAQDDRSKAAPSKRKSERPQEYMEDAMMPYPTPAHMAPYAQPFQAMPSKYPQYAYSPPPPPPPPQPLVAPKPAASQADVAFFGRVQTFIGDQSTYHEFLKLLNLYTQDIIDLPSLVSRAWLFIGQEQSLWRDFRDIVGWTDGKALGAKDGLDIDVKNGSQLIENTPLPDGLRRGRADAARGWRSHGPSYRQLPPSEISLACSGRDSLCWEVLNDEWISFPNWANDEGFVSKRLNPFEEALHRSEEERHEYDYHIEAVMRTIALLEPIATRIAIMDADERITFRLKPGLGNQTKSIYQRVIKKIYGKESGSEVIQALHDNPCVAVPIVLARLKQKEEEWKRAMREWNRVWKEIDAKNFLKSLDHQAISLKTNDKRTLNAKALVTEIETIRREQRRRALGPVSPPAPHHQLQYKVEDGNVLIDAARLLFSYLDRANFLSMGEREKIDVLWRQFIPMCFALSTDDLGLDEVVPAEDMESVDAGSEAGTSVGDDSQDAASNATATKKGGRGRGGDLRKRALKNTQGRGRGRRPGSKFASPSSSRDASPALSSRSQLPDVSAMDVDSTASTPAPATISVAEAANEASATVEGAIAALNAEEQQDGATAAPEVPSNRTTPEPVAPVPDVQPLPVTKTLDLEEHGQMDKRNTWNAFVNSSLYCMLRLFQVIYRRLEQLKQSPIVVKSAQAPAPITLKNVPSLTSTVFTVPQDAENATIAATYYLKTLAQCERLFDGEIDQITFEDSIRAMFGNQAYIAFGIERLMHTMAKIAQASLADEKVANLVDTLVQDRAHPDRSTPQQQTFYRTQAETLLGSDENLYRVEWRPKEKLLSFQLLGKDVISGEDKARAEREWASYIEKYVSSEPTPGVQARSPLLRRSVKKTAPLGISDFPAHLSTISSLQSKICVRSYKMFFVTGSEDFLHRRVVPVQDATDVRRKKVARFEKWLAKAASKQADDAKQKSSEGQAAANGNDGAKKEGEDVKPDEKSAAAVGDVKMDTK